MQNKVDREKKIKKRKIKKRKRIRKKKKNEQEDLKYIANGFEIKERGW